MSDFSEGKIRYLEMIQGVVTRMESNSFFLKGGTVTLAAGVLALSSAGIHKKYVFIAFVAIVVFWVLDSYYLSLQRKYRRLFNYIRVEESAQIDFDMNYHKADRWTMGEQRTSFLWCWLSLTEWPFYAVIAAIVSILLSFVVAKSR